MTCAFNKAVLAVIALAFMLPLRAWPQASVMQKGDVTIAPGQIVRDVVVSGGDLVVAGTVEGAVFVAGGDVVLRPGAVVRGALTVLGGDLTVEARAVAEGEINVLAGRARIETGAKVKGPMQAMEEVTSLTPERLLLVERYLVFSREFPGMDYALAGLGAMDERRLSLRKVHDGRPDELDLFDLGEVRLSKEDLSDSYEVVYRGHHIWARVVALRYKDSFSLDKLWDLVFAESEERVKESVHNSLGDGAHWFFRYRGASYCLWRDGWTFMAVMVRHVDERPESDEWEQVEQVRDRILAELPGIYHSAAPAAAAGDPEDHKERRHHKKEWRKEK